MSETETGYQERHAATVAALAAARTELSRLRGVVEAVQATLATVRRERDVAHRLLRVLRTLGHVPDGALGRAVNCAVALESEGDIEDARREAAEWIAANLPDEPPFEVEPPAGHDSRCEARYICGPFVPCGCGERRKRAYVDKWLADHNMTRVSVAFANAGRDVLGIVERLAKSAADVAALAPVSSSGEAESGEEPS